MAGASGKPVLAADFGGTRIKLGLVRAGEVLARALLPAEARGGLAARLEALAAAVRELLASQRLSASACAGVALALPSLVDVKAQRVRSTNDKYPDAAQIGLAGWARETLGLPLYLDNDANAALAGEWLHGAGRGHDDLVLMVLGTGVGSSAIIEGVPLRGAHGQAGCLGGHFVTDPFGAPCNCGGIGCLETQASTWALPRLAREQPGLEGSALAREPVIDYAAVFRLAAAGDAVALALRERSLRVWAAGAVNLIHAYDPEVLILAGGLMQSGDIILPAIERFVHQHAWLSWGKPKVVRGQLGDDAALLGAAGLLERHEHVPAN